MRGVLLERRLYAFARLVLPVHLAPVRLLLCGRPEGPARGKVFLRYRHGYIVGVLPVRSQYCR